VSDRLRLFLNRPLHEGDPPRQFVLAATVVAAAVGVLALLDDTGPMPAPPQTAERAAAPTTLTLDLERLPEAGTETPAAPGEESNSPATLLASRTDIARSKRAARHFLTGYLAFGYGRGTADRIDAVTPELRDRLARERPRVPAREQRRRPQVVLVRSNGVSRERAHLLALVCGGARR
jgi:hypothetical protein